MSDRTFTLLVYLLAISPVVVFLVMVTVLLGRGP